MGRQQRQEQIRKVKRWLIISQLTNYEGKVLCSGKENKNAQVKNQEDFEASPNSADRLDAMEVASISSDPLDAMEVASISSDPPDAMEVSSIPTDPLYAMEESSIPTDPLDMEVSYIPTDPLDAMEVYSILSDPPDAMEVSPIPTDPHEWERRMERKEEEQIRRQVVRPPPDYEDDLLHFGKTYLMKFAKKAKNGYKNMRERYPDLKKVLVSLNTSKDRTYDQNAMSLMPLDQSINEDVNTENLRFGMVPSAASPAHRPLEPAEPAPGPTQPEAPAHIHVRTVQEINALPGEHFIHLLTAAVSDLHIAAMKGA